jgi:hypothetical protein
MLLLMPQTILAAPVEASIESSTSAADAATPEAAAVGQPKCKTAAHYNLCVMSDNTHAYCNDQGKFINDFMLMCQDVCWCA